MEGPLWKWTNYFSGWQPRWFILDNGILSYYKSQDDVNSGCKGSVKMAVCDVNVHSTDNTRLDLIIPGEAHFYVKAATPQERQQWLVALGSCKACLTTANRRPSETEEVISPDILKVKKSELRLYCDLLMQQVHGVKTAVSNGVLPNVEKLNEATSLLSATCDTFINTLEDCMTVAQAKASYESNSKASMQQSNSADSKFSSSGSHKYSKSSDGASSSISRHLTRSKSESSATHMNSESQNSYDYLYEHYERDTSVDLSSVEKNGIEDSDSNVDQGQISEENGKTDKHLSNHNTEYKTAPMKQYETFFTTMPATFKQIQLGPDDSVPVKPYLDACRAILAIFDKLSSSALSPVKMDIDGNIKKINQKYITDPERFTTLQTIALHDKNAGLSHLSSSATVAMVWLKRAIEFIRELLAEILTGKPDLTECANNAYARTLRPFHGWVVRGVFGLAVKSLPYRKDFLAHLAESQEDFEQPDFMPCLMSHMEAYIKTQDVILNVLTDFFHKNDLENPEQV